MEIGGSQINAIELGSAVRNMGHEVTVLSEPGPLVTMVRDLGLDHVEIPLSRGRPSPVVMRALVELVRHRRIDVVHGHEWPPVVEAFLGPFLRLRTPTVATVMSMAVAPFLPRGLPLVVGTEDLRRQARANGYEDATLIAPPVDLVANAPDFDPGDFRVRHGLDPDRLLVVVCCRLVKELKLEGLLVACETIGELSREGHEVQLAVVGDGAAREAVRSAAERANAGADRAVVVLTGELPDPRPAYAAADVVLGMGGSALRGMAFGKPLVVQGEGGFWRVCRPDTIDGFLSAGWYGTEGGDSGHRRLRSELMPLLADAAVRRSLGEFSRHVVVTNFGLEAAARVQADVYARTLHDSPGRYRSSGLYRRDLARLATMLTAHKVRRRVRRALGTHTVDDFNAVGAAAASNSRK
ncbi:glycosyltransferase [Kineosporia mesophila]|nr:glycosyltransferase [Kineosporia mesophila]